MSDATLRLLGAFVMLIVGFAVYVLTDRVAYRPLRRRYEHRKAMGRRGLEPNTVMAFMRIGAGTCFLALVGLLTVLWRKEIAMKRRVGGVPSGAGRTA